MTAANKKALLVKTAAFSKDCHTSEGKRHRALGGHLPTTATVGGRRDKTGARAAGRIREAASRSDTAMVADDGVGRRANANENAYKSQSDGNTHETRIKSH